MTYEAIAWQEPKGPPDTGSGEAPEMTECSGLGFTPEIRSIPTTTSAESASGFEFALDLPNEGLTNPHGRSNSDVKKAVVTLPAGMTVNPSSANGLAACPLAGYEAESLSVNGCPQASKIGEVELESPLLGENTIVRGDVFLATPEENPFGSLIALYLVIKDPGLGLLVKRPIKVEAGEEQGPNAGRLITTLEDAPQLPFSHFRFHFKEGARAPLLTPPACGTYATETTLTPWSDPENPVTRLATFEVTSGVGGGPCPPGGVPPFKPDFEGGSMNNAAGAYSPFQMRLTRKDGEQEMTRFDAVLPKGTKPQSRPPRQRPGARSRPLRAAPLTLRSAPASRGRGSAASSPTCPARFTSAAPSLVIHSRRSRLPRRWQVPSTSAPWSCTRRSPSTRKPAKSRSTVLTPTRSPTSCVGCR